jgi:nucleoid-associated protein YgaU
MRRVLFLLPVTAVMLTACENQNAEPKARQEEAYKPSEERKYELAPTYVDTGATMEPMDPSPPPAAKSGAGRTETAGDEVLTPGGSGGGRTYVVQKGDTLYAIARKFYGEQSKWKVIYNANRGQLTSPDKLKAGMKLVIP